MKVPTFIKKINGRRNSSSSNSRSTKKNDNVETRGIEEVQGLDGVGLSNNRSTGESGGKELFSEHLPVDMIKKTESDAENATAAETPSSSATNEGMFKYIPSLDKFSSERSGDDATTVPSTTLDQHIKTVLAHRERRLSNQSADSLSMLLNDGVSETSNEDIRNLFKVESSRSLVPLRGISRGNNRSERTIGGLSMSMTSTSLAMGSATGRCPFKHGTVYTGPYPGYVHGNPKRGICPNGCKPEVNSDITDDENPAETMLREANEYLELYYFERNEDMSGTEGFLPKKERMAQVRKSIHETGIYAHTFDELEHGARVAWRNAPKCSNRKYWQQLKLLDCRDVDTNEGIFGSCMKHLTKAVACGSAEAYITVFRPATPGTSNGPRIWNDQLLQYAAYNHQDGDIIGDPKNLRFTQMLEERFGWKGPPDGKQGAYDYLPLVIQSNPEDNPQVFEVPLECAPAVHIHHPENPELSELGMQWYPIPAVCALDMTVGGILYTAVPFNGWYANTEVLRDLTDEGRYNMLVPVANALGLDPNTKPGDEPLWKDEVMTVLNKAVYHSFKVAKIAMIGHHNLIDMFWEWYKDEIRHRKYCPVNWKWVIPPMTSSTNKAYLGLHKCQEYTLKPAYLYGKDFLALEREHFGKRDTAHSMRMFFTAVHLAIFFKGWIKRIRQKRQPVLILYASVTGNAATYAGKLGSILRACSHVTFFDCCGTNAAEDLQIMKLVKSTTLCIFITSTQGNGELPSLSRKFFSTLFGKKGHVLLDKNCAVLGFGSSAYPIFCGAATELSNRVSKSGGWEIVPRGLCDAVKGEDMMFQSWVAMLVNKLASTPDASPLVFQLSERINDINQTNNRRQIILESVTVQLFSSKEVKEAAVNSFMSRRGSGASYRRAVSSRRSSNVSSRRSSAGSSDHSLDGSDRFAPARRISAESFARSRPNESQCLSDDGSLCIDNSGRVSSRRRSNAQRLPSDDDPSHLDGSLHCVFEADVNNSHGDSINEAIAKALLSNSRHRRDVFEGIILSRDDLLGRNEREEEIAQNSNTEHVRRKTCLVKIDLELCGNPPYQPGDHVQVYPHNTISDEKLRAFIGHLAGKLSLDDQMYVTFESDEVSLDELAVTAPILHHNIDQLVALDYFFKTQASTSAPIPTQSCLDLSYLATSAKDSALLEELGSNKAEYDKMFSLCGLKWMDAFDIFPSLSGQVTLPFLLYNMKLNHPRSYSIASCKSCVGSEIDLVVGSFLYSRGGYKVEAGVCSNFLTNVTEGDEITFKIESNPSFHHPLDPSAPVIFICTGTGFAPIRGLLQKRSYFRSRGEKMGAACLVFGSRSSKEGLFAEEIEDFIEEGTLTDVYKCYSREPGMKKQYTTDIMQNESVEQVLAPILKSDDCHVYVCGSANMAEMCKSVMVEMTSKFHVNKLIEEGRLHSDVFGALTPARSVVDRSKSTSTDGTTAEHSSGRVKSRRSTVQNTRSSWHMSPSSWHYMPSSSHSNLSAGKDQTSKSKSSKPNRPSF